MSKEKTYNFPEILGMFRISGDVADILKYGSGHINSTFHIKMKGEGSKDYLLQRVNDYVFKNVPGLINNIKLVTDHLRDKLKAVAGSDPENEVLLLIPTKDGRFYYKDQENNFWRMYYYIQNTKSYDVVETPQQAYEGGKAFGKFQTLLSDLDSKLLIETIPDFHNVQYRLNNLQNAIQQDPVNRLEHCTEIITFLKEREDAMRTILRLGKEGKLPLRITHNDTKFNNVLLDENDKAKCVIDLDTVMPGYVAYDFGDAIRSIVNTAAEDEKDLSRITINLTLFEAYAAGYLEEANNFLTDIEKDTLVDGVLLLPYMQTVRFLTDYIDGDKYYKIDFPEHNMQRTLAQLELFKKLEDNYSRMKNIVQEVLSSFKVTQKA